MRHRPVADLSDLPTYGFGSQSPIWWGTLGFVALEGTGFALAIGAYLYLAHLAPTWPIAPPQHDIWAATIITGLLVVSAVPNMLLDRWARQQDLRKVRFGLVVMSLFGIAPLIVRIFEFDALTVLWDTNAYGSVVWFLLGLHTTHLLTDAGDTIVLTVLMFTRHAKSGKRFSDVSDNAFYWHFVVASWLPIYLLLYWVQ
ncbi:cytochrome c oxidase subunit 3 [Inquilinus ginsengisoli]|uniref:cytochrome c oxidase subunit 3 n=1 Tax=Inquilinus ginsengisoli TaxID=363840 RepID=UPI003D242BBC